MSLAVAQWASSVGDPVRNPKQISLDLPDEVVDNSGSVPPTMPNGDRVSPAHNRGADPNRIVDQRITVGAILACRPLARPIRDRNRPISVQRVVLGTRHHPQVEFGQCQSFLCHTSSVRRQ